MTDPDRYAPRVTRTNTNTFHARTDPSADIGGRFAHAGVEQATVNGAAPVVDAPAAPAWATKLPDELPLGYSVEEMEPTGEIHEIEASMRTKGVEAPGRPQGDSDPASAAVDPVAQPSNQLKRRV